MDSFDPDKLRESVSNSLKSGFEKDLNVDVAIIGAGLSGLYTAYRLTLDPAYQNKKIQIFEMGDRIGGRLYSTKLPESNIYGELGGMRYLTSQEIVTKLIEEVFKLPDIPFLFGDGCEDRLIGYYRGERYRNSDWTNGQDSGYLLNTCYKLNPEHIGMNSDQLFNVIIAKILLSDPKIKEKYADKIKPEGKYNYTIELSREEWDQIKPEIVYYKTGSPYDGIKLNDLGFWNVLKDQAGQEGFNFLADAGAYYSNTVNWNAAEAMPYIVGDFSGTGVSYKTIKGGYDLIAYKLAEEYLKTKDAAIWSQNKLHSFSGEAGNYVLEFVNLPSKTNWNVKAAHIVLAMPQRSLELLQQNCNPFFEDDKLKINIASLIKEPSYKILVGFNNKASGTEGPWWDQGYKTPLSGHSITDLPMRQCYYFGTDKENNRSMLLASYNDMRTVPFWKRIEPTGVKKEELFKLQLSDDRQSETSDEFYKKHANLLPTDTMVKEVMNQLKELHNDPKIPSPYVALYKDWSEDPFGGGYHGWKPKYSVKDTMEYMRKPSDKDNIYIIGEAYSTQQGWVEGAFCVAELMLEKYFGLKRPSWVASNYYLGW